MLLGTMISIKAACENNFLQYRWRFLGNGLTENSKNLKYPALDGYMNTKAGESRRVMKVTKKR